MVIPSNEEIRKILKESGAYREGHFLLPNGAHTDIYVQLPLAMRFASVAHTLGVALSRLLRVQPKVRAHLPHVSIVAPASGGIPVAYRVADALNADEVFWAEKNNRSLYFREFIKIEPGRKVILVDDVVRKGDTLLGLVKLVYNSGGEILAIGSVINQSYDIKGFGDIVYVNLHDIPTKYVKEISKCEMCKARIPLTKIVKE